EAEAGHVWRSSSPVTKRGAAGGEQMGGVERVPAGDLRVEGLDDRARPERREVRADLGVDVERDRDAALGRELQDAQRGGDAADGRHVEAEHVERVRVEERAEGGDVRHLVPDADGLQARTPDSGAALRVLRDEWVLEPRELDLAPEREL